MQVYVGLDPLTLNQINPKSRTGRNSGGIFYSLWLLVQEEGKSNKVKEA